MGAAGDGFVLLLELTAADDLPGFRRAVEDGLGVDAAAPWYGRWGRRMGFELRTPLMVAAAYGSTAVMGYLLATGAVDVNRACGSDGATALHCAAAGGSPSAAEAVRMLVEASADVDAVDSLGNKPADVVPLRVSSFGSAKTRSMMALLKGGDDVAADGEEDIPSKRGEKKEYPADLTLPDIKNGIYSSDEFRMYTFKVKPCSRAYSHDWTECPFAHPGENARRRDPRRHHYSCVPCPEFRKGGACRSGDACEYAHGVFECWLHPAQYRTRLCKDETGCARRVCFFAHKPEELRPLYQPLTPSSSSAPMASAAAAWLNQAGGVMAPTLQLPASRLKASLSSRKIDMDMELLGLEAYHHQQQQQQQLVDDMVNLSSPSWKSALVAASTADAFASLNSPSLFSQFQGLSLRQSSAAAAAAATGAVQFQSPHQSVSQQQLLSGYNSSNLLPSSPSVRATMSPLSSSSSSSSIGLDHSLANALVNNSKASAFAKRSQSFIDRGATGRPSGFGMANLAAPPPALSDWGSPDGKLDWGIHGEELNKLRKCASFGLRSNGSSAGAGPPRGEEQQMQQLQRQYQVNKNNEYNLSAEMLSPWMEPMYAEQEQMVA